MVGQAIVPVSAGHRVSVVAGLGVAQRRSDAASTRHNTGEGFLALIASHSDGHGKHTSHPRTLPQSFSANLCGPGSLLCTECCLVRIREVP